MLFVFLRKRRLLVKQRIKSGFSANKKLRLAQLRAPDSVHRHFLRGDGLERYISETPRLSLRRGKNLADLVVNARAKGKEGGSRPCGRGCKLCKFMMEAREVKDKKGELRKIKKRERFERIILCLHRDSYYNMRRGNH